MTATSYRLWAAPMPANVPVHVWLVDVRTSRKLGQDEVDRRTKELGARISQSYLSQLERGVKSLEDLGAAKMDALRRVYKISPEEWAEKTGLAVVTATRPLTDAERRGWVLPEEDEEPEIPLALQIAAEKYGHGDNAPLAERRWLVELADLDFREEPETPEDWLAIYSRLSKLIDPKAN